MNYVFNVHILSHIITYYYYSDIHVTIHYSIINVTIHYSHIHTYIYIFNIHIFIHISTYLFIQILLLPLTYYYSNPIFIPYFHIFHILTLHKAAQNKVLFSKTFKDFHCQEIRNGITFSDTFHTQNIKFSKYYCCYSLAKILK